MSAEQPLDRSSASSRSSSAQLLVVLSGSVLAASAASLVFVASWFYGYFGVSPEEVGLGPTSSRVHAVIGITLLWVAGVGVVLWAVVTAWIRAGRTKRETAALTDRQRRTRLLVVVGGVTLATLFQLAVLSVLMVRGAGAARDGSPVGGWLHPTNRVTVTYLGETSPEIVGALDGCLVYLGHSDNVTVLLNATSDAVVRLPTSDLLVVAPVDQNAELSSDCE